MLNPAQLIHVYLKEIENIREEYRKFIADKNIPLNVRWNAFLSIPQMHETRPIREHIPVIPCDWSQALNVYRFERIDLIDIVTRVERGEYDHILPTGRTNVDATKEYLLANNLGACINDW